MNRAVSSIAPSAAGRSDGTRGARPARTAGCGTKGKDAAACIGREQPRRQALVRALVLFMDGIRIACVKYLNTSPLVEGLEKLSDVVLKPAAPSRIAEMVRQGEADIGLASVIDAAGGDLVILPVGMIGCDGPTLTVRLFSRVPLKEIRTVHADTESHTSVVLCRVLLKRLYGVSAGVEAFEAGGVGGRMPEVVLLIGDKVVTGAPPMDDYPYQLDLGEAWKGLTGLPFVYAMWLCRAERTDDPAIHRAAALLDRQRRHNGSRLDWIVAAQAQRHGWPRDLAARYLGGLLRYEVGAREREAVGRFFEMAAEEGLVGSSAARWVEPVGAA